MNLQDAHKNNSEKSSEQQSLHQGDSWTWRWSITWTGIQHWLKLKLSGCWNSMSCCH